MIAGLESVVVDLVKVDFSRQVMRSDEAFLDVPSEIPTIEEAKFAEAQKKNDAVGVIGFVFRLVGGK